MVVRFKLDAYGIKLTLAEWIRITLPERKQFAIADCNTVQQVIKFREDLRQLILERTGSLVATIKLSKSH
jgi:hypothetical protein